MSNNILGDMTFAYFIRKFSTGFLNILLKSWASILMRKISIERIALGKREEERYRLSSACAHGSLDAWFSETEKMETTLSELT